MYYLETNAIIKYGNKLKEVVDKSRCLTSHLAIIEIMKNLNENTFKSIQNRIKTIAESQILIDWYSTRQRIHAAFPMIGYTTTDNKNIKKMFDILLRVKSFSELTEITKYESNISFADLKSFASSTNSFFDHIINNFVSNSTLPGTTKQKQSIFRFLNNELEGFDSKEIKDLFLKKSRTHFLQLFSMFILIDMGENTNLSNILLQSYDGSLDCYFGVLNYYLQNKISFESKYKNNDIFDIEHFVYLQKKPVKIVSNDRLVRKMGEYIGERRINSTDELLAKIHSK